MGSNTVTAATPLAILELNNSRDSANLEPEKGDWTPPWGSARKEKVLADQPRRCWGFLLRSELVDWIALYLRVPTGAVLGGGNRTALWAADQLNGCLATEKELQEWSGEIGSDVSNRAAYYTGRARRASEGPVESCRSVGKWWPEGKKRYVACGMVNIAKET
ncbi:hypothetical protein L1987_43881 [Smallanthus sonchifolius]|uniref:Uncharacterized protein n=1 Tax=Smallanthus sonchifolius TaxID=185202 RepID=A0ACB9GNJ8_9ASTR|nr:hypothetical protein L1987_43881 [Smallanthus sonchifolius]